MNPLRLLLRHGQRDYIGEKGVSQASHMLQAALLAEEETGDPYDIAAALLHDIGHLLVFETGDEMETMGGYGIAHHEDLGADYLRDEGFPPEVYEAVRLHVAAKRYLCTTTPSYLSLLSDASLYTFHAQGGKMTPAEVEAFRSSPHHERALRLRHWDDRAKLPHWWKSTKTVEAFTPLLTSLCVE